MMKSKKQSQNVQEPAIEDEKEENEEPLRRSTRERKPPIRYGDPYAYSFIYANYCNAAVPDNYEEALNCSEAENWKIAMKKEIDSLERNKTWRLVKKPEDKKALDVKWIYKKKSEKNYKARLVVRGFQQEEIIDNTYSPVFKMQTLKILLSYCCKNNLSIDQMDVETAFLNSKVMSEIYIKQPLGYQDGSNRVLSKA